MCRPSNRRSPVPGLLGFLAMVGALACPAGWAQESAPIALVKAYSHRGASSASSGTATLVAKGEFGYWLTADHVTENAGYVEIQTPAKRWAGKIFAKDPRSDLSLVQTSAADCPEPIRVWTGHLNSSLERTMDFYAEGYANASFSGHGRRKGRLGSLLGAMTRWTLPSIPGDSGGCVWIPYKGRRYLSGVVSGSNWPGRSPNADGYTIGASPESIRTFLTSSGLQMDASGQVSCIGRRTLGGRRWADPLQDT